MYTKSSRTNKIPTEIIIPKFQLPSRSLELPNKHYSFQLKPSIPKKRSTSFNDISDQLRQSEPMEKLVSAKYHKCTISRSFDEYSSPNVIPIYEFAFATAVQTEAVMDDLASSSVAGLE